MDMRSSGAIIELYRVLGVPGPPRLWGASHLSWLAAGDACFSALLLALHLDSASGDIQAWWRVGRQDSGGEGGRPRRRAHCVAAGFNFWANVRPTCTGVPPQQDSTRPMGILWLR